jgi:hypothetical protein
VNRIGAHSTANLALKLLDKRHNCVSLASGLPLN